MNIVLTGNFTFPTGSAAAARLRNLSEGLVENGANVTVLPLAPLFAEPGLSDSSVIINRTAQADLQSQASVSQSLYDKAKWGAGLYTAVFPAMRTIVQLHRRQTVDLVVCYGRNALLIQPIVWLCSLKGIRTLLDVTELADQFNGIGGRLNPMYWDCKYGTGVMPKSFDLVTAISHELKAVYESRGCQHVILMPSIEAWGKPRLPEINKDKHFFEIVYVGSLIPRDAPEQMLEVLQTLVDRQLRVRLRLIGRFASNPYGVKIIESIKRNPRLAEHVDIIGSVSDAELVAFTESADGLWLSRRDARTEVAAFPTRLVEFLRRGRPVFASDVGDIGHYLRDGHDAVLLSPADPIDSADKIEAVMVSPDRGYQIGLNGQQRGSVVFNRTVYAGKILQALQDLSRE